MWVSTLDRAKSKESVRAQLSYDLIVLLSNPKVWVRLQYIPAISFKQGFRFLLHDRVCAVCVEAARKSNPAKLFVCEAVEIPTMRLGNEDSVCSVSNLAGVGEESALLNPQGVTLPRLVAVRPGCGGWLWADGQVSWGEQHAPTVSQPRYALYYGGTRRFPSPAHGCCFAHVDFMKAFDTFQVSSLCCHLLNLLTFLYSLSNVGWVEHISMLQRQMYLWLASYH